MIAAVLFEEGLLSRSNPSADRARAGRTGAPRNGRRGCWQKVERREAQRPPSMGARGLIVPREVGPLIPPQRVPRKHSGASRRSIAPAHFARDTGKPRTQSRRENAEAWLFEIVDAIRHRRCNTLGAMRGPDPRIHPSSQRVFRRAWIAGSNPAMTGPWFPGRSAARSGALQSRGRYEHRWPVRSRFSEAALRAASRPGNGFAPEAGALRNDVAGPCAAVA